MSFEIPGVGSGVIQAFGRGYKSAREGERFIATPQDPSAADVSGQTSFDETTPTFLISLDGSALRLVLSRIVLTITNTPGADVRIAVAIDPTDRFSSGGTSHTPASTRRDKSDGTPPVAAAAFRTGATASAAGSGDDAPRFVHARFLDNVAGETAAIDFLDGVLVEDTGSILVYTWAGTTAPDWSWVIEWTEEDY